MQTSDASTTTPPAGLAARWRFLLIAGGLYLLWLVVYEGYVKADGRLDTALCTQLAEVATGLLRAVGFPASLPQPVPLVYMDGQPAVVVGTPCNGLALYALFTGFVLAFPAPWRPRLWFIPLGVVVIYLLNVVRIAILALNHHYAHRSVDFNHHYTYTFIVYGCICAMWMWWVRRHGPSTAEAQ